MAKKMAKLPPYKGDFNYRKELESLKATVNKIILLLVQKGIIELPKPKEQEVEQE